MPIDKLLQKIHQQLSELEGSLDTLRDDTVQPSVEDCEKALIQLYKLTEHLAVYKHHKQNNELSPSFNIHAKISEKHIAPESESGTRKENKAEHLDQAVKPPVTADPTRNRSLQPLAIGLNDKFRFINELFSQNASEYHIVFEQLTTLNSWSETEIYLNSLKSVYGWKENNEVVKYFYSLLKRRFDQ